MHCGHDRSGSEALLGRITRLLIVGEGQGYCFPERTRARLEALVEDAATAPGAPENIGAVLKLIHVLETRHEAPSAAEALVDALNRSPRAMQLIALHWSSGSRRPRLGPDLQPVPRARAPHVQATRPRDSIRVSAFLSPRRLTADGRGR